MRKADDLNSALNDFTSIDYCINKAIPDGSNLYYATLFEAPKNKTIIVTLHAFLYELSDIIEKCSDPGIARIKLKWWEKEIECLLNKQARHPVTRQMQQCINFNRSLKSIFDGVIDFFNHFIFIEQVESLDSILSLYESTTGEIWYQCGQQLDQNKKASLDVIREIGALSHFITCLQQPHTYINETRCIIPVNYINQPDLLNLRIQSTDKRTKQKEIFSPLLIEIKHRLDETYIRLKEESLTDLKYSMILNRLTYKTCDKILRDDCNLLGKNISLTPLIKLWLAWKTRTFP